MNKVTMTKTRDIGAKAYHTAKIILIVIIAGLTIVGGYVVSNTQLRNQTIDYAQNQKTVQAASPKGSN